jgi:hypothetical protein
MSGTLTESFIVSSSEAGPRHSPYSIHKVTIAPLEQEMRRDMSVWGMLFDFHVITGMMSPAGFAFATRGEGKGDGWSNRKCNKHIQKISNFFLSISPLITCQVKDLGPEDRFFLASIINPRFFLFSFLFL